RNLFARAMLPLAPRGHLISTYLRLYSEELCEACFLLSVRYSRACVDLWRIVVCASTDDQPHARSVRKSIDHKSRRTLYYDSTQLLLFLRGRHLGEWPLRRL